MVGNQVKESKRKNNMSTIAPLKNNLRVCEKCSATYVINGDPSEYWCELKGNYPVYGRCEFCRPGSKYYTK